VLVQMTGLPEGVQGLEARSTVTYADYGRIFAPLIDRIRGSGERLRLLYQFGPDFHRITAGGLWADSRLGVGYIALMDGCALVSDIDWIRDPGRGIAPWLPCPMRVYDNAHVDDAAGWLASLPTIGEPSKAQTARAYIGGTCSSTVSMAKLLVSRGFQKR
jgi:hypothetical protein